MGRQHHQRAPRSAVAGRALVHHRQQLQHVSTINHSLAKSHIPRSSLTSFCIRAISYISSSKSRCNPASSSRFSRTSSTSLVKAPSACIISKVLSIARPSKSRNAAVICSTAASSSYTNISPCPLLALQQVCPPATSSTASAAAHSPGWP